MRSRFIVFVLALVTAMAGQAGTARAVVPVVFGTSWDGPGNGLQAILDATYGSGRINVQTDYIGARAGDLDPWFWVDNTFSALLVKEIAGNANRNTLGWYVEDGRAPVIDGVGDGVVFDGPSQQGDTRLITFDHPMTKFGFYLDPNGPESAPNAPQPEIFTTNRMFNDRGPDGSGALHVPTNGDVQALVFDISNVVGRENTWLVCFEDLDTGPVPKGCCVGTDNDFNDMVFEVHALGATPTVPLSFGALKMLYR